ncbi:MAG: hypothetical protein NTZ79_17145 [Proteobacteria bacterium]|nr:hypothetical protein [Pseudomonadota bacterium]
MDIDLLRQGASFRDTLGSHARDCWLTGDGTWFLHEGIQIIDTEKDADY